MEQKAFRRRCGFGLDGVSMSAAGGCGGMATPVNQPNKKNPLREDN
jgi:hypothetical protein